MAGDLGEALDSKVGDLYIKRMRTMTAAFIEEKHRHRKPDKENFVVTELVKDVAREVKRLWFDFNETFNK